MKWKNWSPTIQQEQQSPEGQVPSSVQKLLHAITSENTQSILFDLLAVAFPALQRLAKLNEKIFHCYSAYNTEKEESGELDIMITVLRNDIFESPKALLKLQSQMSSLQIDLPEDTCWDSDEFDFGDFDSHSQSNQQGFHSNERIKAHLATTSRPSNLLVGVQESEVEEAFDFLTDDTEEAAGHARFDLLAQDLAMLGITLGGQIQHHEDRLRKAFHAANYSLVIRELDASRTTLLEGIFAYVASIFECFLEDFDTTTLPGYQDVLGQALTARQGTTQLMYKTNEINQYIQSETSSSEAKHMYINTLQHTLGQFYSNEAFHCLSPASRWELVNFMKQLQSQSMRELQQASEGLSKYLESLHMMNQSEIIQQHDQTLIEELQTQLEAAQSILSFSPINAADIVRQTQINAQPLFGRQPQLDPFLEKWSNTSFEEEDPKAIQSLIEQMQTLLS